MGDGNRSRTSSANRRLDQQGKDLSESKYDYREISNAERGRE